MTQAALEPLTHDCPPQPPKCWDYRHAPTGLAMVASY
jgi:hypothetical protein